MERATLTVWNDEKGWGFAEPEMGGRAVFVHAVAFTDGHRPVQGDRLDLMVEDAPRGPRASRAWVVTELDGRNG